MLYAFLTFLASIENVEPRKGFRASSLGRLDPKSVKATLKHNGSLLKVVLLKNTLINSSANDIQPQQYKGRPPRIMRLLAQYL